MAILGSFSGVETTSLPRCSSYCALFEASKYRRETDDLRVWAMADYISGNLVINDGLESNNDEKQCETCAEWWVSAYN